MHILPAESASHRLALATLLCVEAATQPTGDIVREGIELVDPAMGVLTVAETLSMLADLPKPLECSGAKSSASGTPLKLQCKPIVGAEAEYLDRWNAAWGNAHGRQIAARLGPQGYICIRGSAVGGHVVLLKGEEYQAWRQEYKVPGAWSISTDPDPEVRALGAKEVFTIRSGVKDIVVREEILPGEEHRDTTELAMERIHLIEKATAEIAATLPPDLPAEERAARIHAELRIRLGRQGFAGL